MSAWPHPSRVVVSGSPMVTGLLPACPTCPLVAGHDGPCLTDRDDWPVHRPECHDAPIPGRQWYGGCEPADYDSERGHHGPGPRVDPETGICEGCGQVACAECGRENCPDHPVVAVLTREQHAAELRRGLDHPDPLGQRGDNIVGLTPEEHADQHRGRTS